MHDGGYRPLGKCLTLRGMPEATGVISPIRFYQVLLIAESDGVPGRFSRNVLSLRGDALVNTVTSAYLEFRPGLSNGLSGTRRGSELRAEIPASEFELWLHTIRNDTVGIRWESNDQEDPTQLVSVQLVSSPTLRKGERISSMAPELQSSRGILRSARAWATVGFASAVAIAVALKMRHDTVKNTIANIL
jgi:hypothetical protein